MSGFTKGPWTIEPINDGETYQIVKWVTASENDGDPGPYVICESVTGSVEDACNARLIASAPRMYEALKSIFDCYGICKTPTQFVAQLVENGFMEDAHSVLTEIEGKSISKPDLPAAAGSLPPCKDMERALRNCQLLARREINRHNSGHATKIITLAAWRHVLRFCDEVGIEGSILRQGTPDGVTPQAEMK